MIITITGKAGSGKSTAVQFLKSKLSNAKFIDADKLAWELLLKSQVKKELLEAFGKGAFTKNEISRKKLGKIVFSSKKQLKKLNLIIHPLLIKEIRNGISPKQINIIDAALFHELKLGKITDFTVLLKRSSRKILKDSKKVRSFQTEPENYDFLISNNGTMAELEQKVNKLVYTIQKQHGIQ